MKYLLAILIIATKLCATDHSRPVLEPYKLESKRLIFTNWFFVRPGHFDWIDEQGKSVYSDQHAKLDEHAAHFVAYNSPHGIRLFVEPAQHEIPIITTDKPWDKWGIRLATLIYENGVYRLWGTCNSDNKHQKNCYFESRDGANWGKPVASRSRLVIQDLQQT